ncbi:MAG: diaminopimelate epimerase [Oscillospiraceae bacterium]|nr:diaminopimelate epimerase [Oscillospiraceae bacterium]
MELQFSKMHGAGNDYIYIDCFAQEVPNPEEAARFLSDRHFGVGSDGLVLILPSETADVRMRMFNADGSEGKMCGNASRCVGKYVYEKGIVRKPELTLETLSGIKKLFLETEGGEIKSVTVDMGRPVLTPAEIPAAWNGERLIDQPVMVKDTCYRITAVSMGNPHSVVFCDEVAALPLSEIGPAFETLPLFPERVNTEFVRVIDSQTLEMRVWERGSGETLACGTGACASVVAAALNGFCRQSEEITVKLLGGELKITYTESGSVLMRGTATHVFDGVVHLI